MTTSESLTCARCGTGNRLPRRFCAQCGAALPLACAGCGFANDADALFCGGCGVALTAPAAAGAKARLPAEAELRPVTVLFADVCGFTRLSQSMRAEDVHALLQAVFEAADGAIESCGGHVDKHIGDAVMGVFGAPFARGGEPARAVRAARAMIDDVRARTAALGCALDLHIGIAAGEVVASGVGSGDHRAYTVIGPSVNLAARLTDVAGPGEIVIDYAVHRDVPAAQCVLLQDLAIKGVDSPVTAWRVMSFEQPTEMQRHDRPLVGRRHELAQLTGALRACSGTGMGGVVYVRGDPGIGKSRLVSEALRVAQDHGYACHRVLVLDSGTARERDAMRELATGLLDAGVRPDDDLLAARLEGLVARGAMMPVSAALLAGTLDLRASDSARELQGAIDPAARGPATSQALVELMKAASIAMPRLIVVEDLHWSDEATLRHVAALANATASLPALVVLTSRRDGDPMATPWRGTLRGSVTSIDLGPLIDADAARLAAGFVAMPQARVRECVERAAGNPLYLEQLLRAPGEQDDRLPASLHSLVLARVDRLPERDRAALRAGATAGQRFPLALVRELTGMADYECALLLDHQLVQRDGTDYLFGHALIRDGIYASITHARRRALHMQAAQWYRDHDLALFAEHLARAESPLAAQAYRSAALAEHAALRPERALALADRGVALAASANDVCALHLLRVDLLKEIGDGPRVAAAARAALAAAGSALERCRAYLGIAAAHRLTGDADVALEALADAEELARAGGFAREAMELHYLRGNVQFAQGRFDEVRTEHARAVEQARSMGDTEQEARSLGGLGDADYAQGRIRSAFARFDACLALCDAHGHVRIAVPNRVMRGHCRSYLGDFEAARQDISASAELAARVGNRHAEMFALQSLGVLYTGWNRCAEAVASQDRALAMARELGARRYLPSILAHRAESLYQAGDRKTARTLLDEGLAVARETGPAFAGPMVLGMLLRVSDPEERRRFAAEGEEILARGGFTHSHVFFRRFAIEDALARGDPDEAVRHAAALENYTRAEPLPYTDVLIERARAVAAHLRAPDEAESRTAVARARARADAFGWQLPWPA